MADIRKDFQKTAQDLGNVGRDAAYVLIGLGVLAIQKAQVRRNELLAELDRQREGLSFDAQIEDARVQMRKALKELDRNLGVAFERVDATLEPVEQRLPAGAQAMMQQAKDARDQLRQLFASRAA